SVFNDPILDRFLHVQVERPRKEKRRSSHETQCEFRCRWSWCGSRRESKHEPSKIGIFAYDALIPLENHHGTAGSSRFLASSALLGHSSPTVHPQFYLLPSEPVSLDAA